MACCTDPAKYPTHQDQEAGAGDAGMPAQYEHPGAQAGLNAAEPQQLGWGSHGWVQLLERLQESGARHVLAGVGPTATELLPMWLNR